MNPVRELSLAVRQLAAHGTHIAGWAAASVGVALGALSYGVRTLARPASARGVVLEAGAMAMHLVMYPWGALGEQLHPGGPYNCYRTDDLHPAERGLVIADMRAAGTPILLIHGFADNRSVFAVLRRALSKRGFGIVYGLNYSVFTGDIRSAARQLRREVERICEATSAEQVHVVGHSLGGLIARYYVQRLGGDARVHTLVTLGTPHNGTMAAYLLPTSVLRQLRPGSDVVAELAAPSSGCRTRFVAVWSDLDEFIVPQRHARLDHPDLLVINHQLSDVGHLALPIDPRAVHTVASTLAQLDEGPSADLAVAVAAGGSSPDPP
jgi:triacylglycerol lipase